MTAKVSLIFIALCLLWNIVSAQVSVNTDGTSPDGSSMLDVKSTNKGVLIPRLTTAERDAIVSPATGLWIFNTTTDCIEIFNESGWWNICNSHSVPQGVTVSASTNPVCAGTTLTLTGNATGATRWSWTGPNGFTSTLQSPTIGGITPAAEGVYTLTASNAAGSASAASAAITVNTVPPGAAGSIAGTGCVGQGMTGVAYSVAQVTGATDYTWSYSGTGFSITTGAGTRSITADYSTSYTPGNLTVTPSNGCGNGSSSALYPVSLASSSCNGTFDYSHTVVAATYTWLDRNLGASRVASSSDDYLAYGSEYQWGRQGDGHQCINWCSASTGTPETGTTSTQCTNGICSNSLFVIIPGDPWDWNTPQSNILWNGASKGANDPCPSGYRIPSSAELAALNSSFSPQGYTGAFNSPIKMTTGGRHDGTNNNMIYPGAYGFYWSSTHMFTAYAFGLQLNANSGGIYSFIRSYGYSVRCIAQ